MAVNIPIQQARNIYTQTFLGAWRESLPVTNFMRSFFETKLSPTKDISVEVMRGTRKIAADIVRGNEGNKNKFGLSSSKIYQPPYFAENFNNTDLMLYDQIFGTNNEAVAPALLQNALSEIVSNFEQLKSKIERSYEKQAADVMQTGKVTSKSQDTIDYFAKATHIKTLSTKWDAQIPNILKSLSDQMNIMKIDGAAATEFNLICGDLALYALTNSAEYKSNFSLYQRAITEYNFPRVEKTTGAVFINRLPIGPYIVNVWSYNDTYEDASGASVPFLDPKKVIIVAESFKGFMSFAAVPRVLSDNGILQNANFAQTLDMGAYFLNNYVKQEVSSHVFEIKSAGLAVPLTIDHFSCLTVLA